MLPKNRERIERCVAILVQQIPTCTEEDQQAVRNCLRDPVAMRFKSVLLVAEGRRGVVGFALIHHDPQIRFTYLDYVCSAPGRSAGGVGGALYLRVREEALAFHAHGLFFECWPDDPDMAHHPDEIAQNVQRLRFYERLGARPILNTHWDKAEASDVRVAHLMYDGLDSAKPLRRATLRRVIGALLERRYAHVVTPEEAAVYLASATDDPVRLRAPRYAEVAPPPITPLHDTLPMVLTPGDEEHRVAARSYYETPIRIPRIRDAMVASGLARVVPSKAWPDLHLRRVHRKDFLAFLDEVREQGLAAGPHPEVFAPRRANCAPRSLVVRAGVFTTDGFTPLTASAVRAARRAVDGALTAAQLVLDGEPIAYSLARPPGHHAESANAGGYCYYANAAIAAEHLVRAVGRVAMLDLDYHHGNGQQDIFYRRADVLTVSVHADPAESYPFFAGFADEAGEGAGAGFNVNLPLPLGIDGPTWLADGVRPALARIAAFDPTVLVVCLGLDPAAGDPTGSWRVRWADFRAAGRAVGSLGRPTLVVQEGGYRTRTLGSNAVAFFTGLMGGRGLLRP